MTIFYDRPESIMYILAFRRFVKNPDARSKKNKPKGAFYPPKLSTYPHVSTRKIVDSMRADDSLVHGKSKNVKKMQCEKNGVGVATESRVKLSTVVDNISGQLVTITEIRKEHPIEKTA